MGLCKGRRGCMRLCKAGGGSQRLYCYPALPLPLIFLQAIAYIRLKTFGFGPTARSKRTFRCTDHYLVKNDWASLLSGNSVPWLWEAARPKPGMAQKLSRSVEWLSVRSISICLFRNAFACLKSLLETSTTCPRSFYFGTMSASMRTALIIIDTA